MTAAAHGIDRGWREAFVLEARLLDLTGAQIGDAVAVVEAHVAESGEPVTEAFGDPVAYARTLAEEVRPDGAMTPLGRRTVSGVVSAVLGLGLLGPGTTALASGEPVSISAGLLACLAINLAVMLVVGRRPTQTLRWLATAGILPMTIGGAAFIGALVTLLLLMPAPLVHLPGELVSLVAAVLILASTWVLWPDLDDDPLGDPRASGKAVAAPVLARLMSLFIPFAGLVIAALSWLLHR